MKQEVIMYTIPLCPYCARAKQFLSGKGILFTEKNILFPKNFKELRKATDKLGVPVTIIGKGKRILTRFSAAEYEKAFKNH